jgi:hypothetical protein
VILEFKLRTLDGLRPCPSSHTLEIIGLPDFDHQSLYRGVDERPLVEDLQSVCILSPGFRAGAEEGLHVAVTPRRGCSPPGSVPKVSSAIGGRSWAAR